MPEKAVKSYTVEMYSAGDEACDECRSHGPSANCSCDKQARYLGNTDLGGLVASAIKLGILLAVTGSDKATLDESAVGLGDHLEDLGLSTTEAKAFMLGLMPQLLQAAREVNVGPPRVNEELTRSELGMAAWVPANP